VLVDAAIVVTENAFRFMEKRGVDPRDRRRVTERSSMLPGSWPADLLLDGDHHPGLHPGLCPHRQEGKLFHPLAFTKTFSMVGATILSVTLVPVLCSLLIGEGSAVRRANPIMRPLVWLYRPVLDFALRHRAITLGIAVLTVAGALALVPKLGKEFMPPLNEGDLMFMPVTDPRSRSRRPSRSSRRRTPPSASSRKSPRWSRRSRGPIRRPIRAGEHDRDYREPQPESAWRPGMTREKLIGEMDAATTLPGVSNIWTSRSSIGSTC